MILSYFKYCFFSTTKVPNFDPERKYLESEYECMNTNNYGICVAENYRLVACARYSDRFCDDDNFFFRNYKSFRC